jgi:3',5'-cyclic-AMP phosphodiesterase
MPHNLAWLTDTHLNFVNKDVLDDLCDSILEQGADSVCITGDISDGPNLSNHLTYLDSRLGLPVHFVLGNHDFYHSSFQETTDLVLEAVGRRGSKLNWLTNSDPLMLTDTSCIVGHDGWYDGRNGDLEKTSVMLSDFLIIEDLHHCYSRHLNYLDRDRLRKILEATADSATESLHSKLQLIPKQATSVLVATHVPPFQESATYMGKISDKNWQPFFSCKSMGDMLYAYCILHPDKDLHVLCGHSHGESEVQILDNLRCSTGGAEYRRPRLQRILSLP